MSVKTWKVIDPSGNPTVIRDLKSFCLPLFSNPRVASCNLRSKGAYNGWRCEPTLATLDESKMSMVNPHFIYVGSEDTRFVRVACRECGAEYVYTPSKLESRHVGCGSCYSKKRGFSTKGTTIDTSSRRVLSEEDGFRMLRENLGETEVKLSEEWRGKGTTIEVLCPTHGWYRTTVGNAIRHKCRGCQLESTAEKNRNLPRKYISKEEVLSRVAMRLGYTPDVRFPEEWRGTKSFIELRCPVHGWYPQNVDESFRHGCPSCGRESSGSVQRVKADDAVKRIRNNLGIGVDVEIPEEWKGMETKIRVFCPEHGWYGTTVECASNYGCPRCSSEKRMKLHGRRYVYEGEKFDSKWEIFVYSYLNENGVPFVRDKKISYTTPSDGKSHTYYCDFYLTEKGRYIEVKGSQFFSPDGNVVPVWKKGLSEEQSYKHEEMYREKHNIAKAYGVTYITETATVNDDWYSHNEGVVLEDIGKYEEWFYDHHTDTEISVWKRD